jgi:predicted alpha/beta superfamily hydrolase
MNQLISRDALRALMVLAVASGCSRPPQAPPAPPEERPIAVATRERLHSKVLNEDRVFDVYVPPSYAESNAHYPVLYLLDGEAHLEHTEGLTRFLAGTSRAPELIVVSLQNIDRPDEHCCRDRDFTPAPDPKFRFDGRPAREMFPTAGGADKFLRFLTEELIPHVEARYRTAAFRVLFGHSLSGLFALYAFRERPDVFRGVIVASPSVWWNDGELAATLPKFASTLAPLERALYFTCANEPEDMHGPLRRLAAALGAIPDNRLRSRFTQLLDENHLSTPHLTLYNGLRFVFDGWPLPETLLPSPDTIKVLNVEELLSHYSRLSTRYGFDVLPPEELLNGVGYLLLDAKRTDAALVLFTRNAALYPQSANAQDSLADGLAQTGRFSEAVAPAERAVAFATQSKDPRLQIWEQRASEIRAKAAAAGTKQRPP